MIPGPVKTFIDFDTWDRLGRPKAGEITRAIRAASHIVQLAADGNTERAQQAALVLQGK